MLLLLCFLFLGIKLTKQSVLAALTLLVIQAHGKNGFVTATKDSKWIFRCFNQKFCCSNQTFC